MGVSFVLMFMAGIVCALAPQDFIASDSRYPLLAIGRFFVACATRGIAITGFVIGMCFLFFILVKIKFCLENIGK